MKFNRHFLYGIAGAVAGTLVGNELLNNNMSESFATARPPPVRRAPLAPRRPTTSPPSPTTTAGNSNSNRQVFKGGRTLPNGKLQLIFWGKPWITQKDIVTPPGGPANTVPSMASWVNAAQQIIASPYLDKLKQYGINKPTMLKPALNSTYTTGTSCNFVWSTSNLRYNPAICGDINRFAPLLIQDSINKRIVPDARVDRSIFYVIVCAPGYGFSRPDPTQQMGLHPAGGIHPSFVLGGSRIPYFVVNNAQASIPSKLSNTFAFSHELAEILTDPDGDGGTQGWVSNIPSEGEIADVCQSDPKTKIRNLTIGAGRFPVYPYWSNSDNTCVVPGGI